ncbi:hypothetical protein EAG_09230 [Camponotus floridanus]|uniref:Uncharacterized protein n=1 Tax=Camponotus floridanus TaxID=104421 RepID=E2AL08_CAMFO|nr:hypothetical protein EAG_09230 [Camponotus floridanus]
MKSGDEGREKGIGVQQRADVGKRIPTSSQSRGCLHSRLSWKQALSGEKEPLELESNDAQQIDIPIAFEYIGILAENKCGGRTRGVYIPNLIAESGPLLENKCVYRVSGQSLLPKKALVAYLESSSKHYNKQRTINIIHFVAIATSDWYVSLGFWIATNRGLITSGKHYSQMRFGERRQMHLSNPPPHPVLHSTPFRHRTLHFARCYAANKGESSPGFLPHWILFGVPATSEKPPKGSLGTTKRDVIHRSRVHFSFNPTALRCHFWDIKAHQLFKKWLQVILRYRNTFSGSFLTTATILSSFEPRDDAIRDDRSSMELSQCRQTVCEGRRPLPRGKMRSLDNSAQYCFKYIVMKSSNDVTVHYFHTDKKTERIASYIREHELIFNRVAKERHGRSGLSLSLITIVRSDHSRDGLVASFNEKLEINQRLQDACSHHRDPYPISLRNQGTFTLLYDAVPFDYDRCYVHCATRTRLSTRNPLIGSGVGLPGFNSPDVPPRESGSSYAPLIPGGIALLRLPTTKEEGEILLLTLVSQLNPLAGAINILIMMSDEPREGRSGSEEDKLPSDDARKIGVEV